MGMQVVLLLLKLCIFMVVFPVHESTGYSISPSPEIFSILSPSEESAPSIGYHGNSQKTSTASPSPLPSGSILHPPVVSQPHKSAPMPQPFQGLVPSISPSSPVVVPSHKSAPIPQVVPGIVPSMPPSTPMVVPSNNSATMPRVVPGIVPSMPPIPPVVPSNNSAPIPQVVQGIVPSMPPSPPLVPPSNKSAPMPRVVQGIVPSMPPSPPIVMPSHKSAPIPLVAKGIVPSVPPSDPSHKRAPESKIPIKVPLAPAPVESPPRKFPRNPPAMRPTKPNIAPSMVSDPAASPVSAPPSSISERTHGIPAAAPPMFNHFPPISRSPTTKGSPPHTAMRPSNNAPAPSKLSSKPVESNWIHSPASSPINPFYKYHHARKRASTPAPAPAPSFLFPPPTSYHQAPIIPPATSPSPTVHPKKQRRRHHPIPTNHAPSVSPVEPPFPSTVRHGSPVPSPASPAPFGPSLRPAPIIPPATSPSPTVHPKKQMRRHHPIPTNHAPSVSPVEPPFPSTVRHGSPVPSPALPAPFGPSLRPVLPPISSPSGFSPRKPKTASPPPVRALPPPPPNQDCSTSITCTEPFTNSPPGSPCGCVWPMQVGLRLSVALYTFFPLVSELAEEIATGVFMKLSQVHIMGANAAGQQLDKTIVLIDLVPLGERFDNTTAFLTFEKFWHKQVLLKASFFGDYEVLYVRYPGLPPSPPSATSSITTLDGGPYSGPGSNGRTIHPLGVDVRRKRNGGLGGSMIAIIVLSCSIAVALCIIAAWLLLLKCGNHARRIPAPTPPLLIPSLAKPSGTAGSMMFASGPSSASMSFGSSIVTYTGSARTFSAGEIEKATDNFHDSRILGEGGFGRVYRGILDDGTQVAVKVLKRDDQQGGREFLAEVEMLSRLHHRNLVKLIGICIEENARCLVYELIPNGSVESHLHGLDKETAPLDWGARIKIALGAARGLAYLHEDSSPHVIHRDFKSSNILLEHDFTPKVADFGLARTALEEGNQHITTRVMGTFGYVAPEYAMTGHLLVKSDVYSYGVVLLELLTGKKPVDMSQPQGQENLVAWARPFLTSKEGLEMIIDPALGSNFPFDSVAKVAAIASMCVQPEVSHRPFMGEVVQALKLVCNECDETKEAGGSESGGQEDASVVDIDTRTSTDSGQLPESSRAHYSMPEYNSSLEGGRALSVSDVFSMSSRIGRQESGSFRRYSSSGPLRTGSRRPFWQRIRGLSGGSNSEHGVAFRL